MNRYTYIRRFAEAVRDSEEILNHCAETFGCGALVQIDDNPAAPLGSDSAPWICFMSWPTAALGPVADAMESVIAIGVGVVSPVEDNAGLSETVTQRSDIANGLEVFGNAKAAEELLSLVIKVTESVTMTSNSIVRTVDVDSDGWTQLPLQTATAILTVSEIRTFQTGA